MAPVRYVSDGRGFDTRNCVGVTKEAAMEKLGVIGGMGAEATSYYYDQVVRHTAATCDQEHIDMVVLSKSTMPDRTLAIKTGEHAELLATMKECAQALESLGCAHIAIPCNTSHYFYDQIQSFTKVPIIHMPRESVRYALAGAVMGECEFDPNLSMPAEPVHKIGIMGTDGTVGAGVYGRECGTAGVEVVYPSEKRQADVMSLIYDDVKAGREPDMDKFDRVMWEFARSGCDRVILACTELSVLQKYREMPEITLDAMDVLVRESIIRSGAPYRLPKRDRFILVGFIWENSKGLGSFGASRGLLHLPVAASDC